MEEKVETINGILIEKSKCRLVQGKYYLIGNINIENSGDIFEINNRFIRLNTNRLIYNLSNKCYELLSSSQAIKGIISYNHKKKQFIYGYFTYNPIYDYKIFFEDKTHGYCFRDCILPLQYREKLSTGDYYHISLLETDDFLNLTDISKELKESFRYDSNGLTDNLNKIFENNYVPDYLSITEDISNFIKDLSFGFEFETIKGLIPNSKLKCLPLIPLRDGSIQGLEYATLPLQGKKGIQALIDSVNELKKRTVYDNSCSLHLHIGNIPRTPEFILAFYKLYSIISDEIFSLFPLYKKYNFGIKRKHYTKPYDFIKLNSLMEPCIDNNQKVINNFSILFDYLSEYNIDNNYNFKSYDFNLNNVLNHPKDPGNNSKWNINNRYHVINFIPLIFGNKKTIEFRIHTPTYDISKIINFLLINSILVNFTIRHQDFILKDYSNFTKKFHNLYKIISYDYDCIKRTKNSDNIYQSLLDYISVRKEYTNIQNQNGNINYNEDDLFFMSHLDFQTKEKIFVKNIQKVEESFPTIRKKTMYNHYYNEDIIPVLENKKLNTPTFIDLINLKMKEIKNINDSDDFV